MPIRAGKLRERITIQEVAEVRSPVGGTMPGWRDICRPWASVLPLSGREFEEAAQRFAEVSHRVEIRARAGLKPKMRVVYKGRLFNIGAILNREERDREMHLLCEELVG